MPRPARWSSRPWRSRNETGGATSSLLSYALNTLARLEHEAGDAGKAFEAAHAAEEIARQHLIGTLRYLPERSALHFAEARTSGLERMLVLLSSGVQGSHPESVRRSWDAVVKSRALVLDEMASRRRQRSAFVHPDLLPLRARANTARERLAQLLMGGHGKRHQVLLELAQAEKDQAEAALAVKSLDFKQEQRSARINLSDVMAALPKGSALVGFVHFGKPQQGLGKETGDAAYAAFVLRGSAPPRRSFRWVRSAQSIHSPDCGTRSCASVCAKPDREPEESEQAYRLAGEALRRAVWDPVVPYLQRSHMVFVVPDGALHRVSFGALPASVGGYLVEHRPLIHYLSAERDLAELAHREQPGDGLLALGAPAFDERVSSAQDAPSESVVFRGGHSACGAFESLAFEPLPASGREVRELERLWRRSESGPVSTVTGRAAREDTFKGAAPGKRVLHLATHGFVLDACPSVLDARDPDTNGSSTDLSRLLEEHPLLLSGLALAGANQRDAVGARQEDGILTAEEVAALDLSGVEWAVLSGLQYRSGGAYRPARVCWV